MMENRPEEKAELEDRAFWILEHADQGEPRDPVYKYRPLFRLWYYTAFTLYRSWTVFDPLKGSGHGLALVVREVIWDRQHDMQRFMNPLEWLKQGFRAPPTISIRDAQLPAGQLVPFLEELARISLSLVGLKEAPSMVEGEQFGFQSYQSWLHVELSWWGDGPDEWKAFTHCVARMREALQQCFD